MNESEVEEDDSSIKVTRFALNYEPPTLIIEFRRNGKLYHKRIRIKGHHMDAAKLTKSLIRHHNDLLNEDMVCQEQVHELIELLLMSSQDSNSSKHNVDSNNMGAALAGGSATTIFRPNRSRSPTGEHEVDLNRVSLVHYYICLWLVVFSDRPLLYVGSKSVGKISDEHSVRIQSAKARRSRFCL
jgi:restriction endonuclease Mrr